MLSRVSFFPKDYNLGELMSTVCSVHVRGWAGMDACSAEGGRRPAVPPPAGGSGSMRVVQVVTPSKPVNSTNCRFY